MYESVSLQGKYLIKIRFRIFVILVNSKLRFVLGKIKSACDLKRNVAVVSKDKLVIIFDPCPQS